MLHRITPADYKNLETYPDIIYGLAESLYGMMAVGWWQDAKRDNPVCYLALQATELGALHKLHTHFPLNKIRRDDQKAEKFVTGYFSKKRKDTGKKHAVILQGTSFFLDVWETLFNQTTPQTLSYGALAALAGRPGASRAAGRAMATNPVALLIPCHRVIASDGSLGGYGYGTELKRKLLAAENA